MDRPFLRNGLGGLFDVFEPTYLRAAFHKPDLSPVLAHLVFGPIEWRGSGGTLPTEPDPLTVVFGKLGKHSRRSGVMLAN